MVPFIGETYEAHVAGITSFGLFVALENGIEGLVHISFLTDDEYEFDEGTYTMIGRRSGNVYRLGDALTVTLAQVNVEKCEIDFVPGKIESLDDLQQLMAANNERRRKRGKSGKESRGGDEAGKKSRKGKKTEKESKNKKGRKKRKTSKKRK